MKTIKNLEHLKRVTKGHQVTAQEIINERTYLKGRGWVDIQLTAEAKQEFINSVLDTLGGQQRTRERLERVLMYSRPYHWGLSRVCLEKYGNSSARFKYIAGQDHTAELNQIRTALK